MQKPPKKKKSTPVTVENAVTIKHEEFKERSVICLNEKDLPEIKDWMVGKKYKLIVDVEMTGMNKPEYGDKSMRAEFRIDKIKSK